MNSVWHLLRQSDREYDPVYHQHARDDILSLSLRQPRVVLDVGCAAGATARLLKERFPDVVVLGVEPNSHLESMARQVCSEFYAQTIEQFLADRPALWLGKVDTVILGDVLEYLVDPFHCLEELHALLSEDAQVLVSLPNIRNASLLDNLAQGDFSYQPAGILDVTHLRFFTRRDAEQLFVQAGYGVGETKFVVDRRSESLLNRLDGKEASTPHLTIRGVDSSDFRDLTSLQFCFLLYREGFGDKKRPAGLLADPDNDPSLSGTLSEDAKKQNDNFYHVWALQRTLSPARRHVIQQAVAAIETPETFHFAVFVAEGQFDLLRETYFALEAQLYPHWQLTVLSFDAPCAWWQESARHSWHLLGDEDDSLLAVNQQLIDLDFNWVATLYPGDRLPPEALFAFAEAASRHPEWSWIYSDEDKFTAEQKRVDPLFKPDFSPDLLRSLHYTGGLSVIRRLAFIALEGFDSEFEGVEDYDFALRLSVHLNPDQIGHVADVLYHRHEAGRISHLEEDELWELGRLAVVRHCQHLDWAAEVSKGPAKHTWRVRYRLGHQPSVVILIPTRDRLEDLRRCVDSVLNLTDYSNYEIVIIDNQSSDPLILDYMAGLEAAGKARVIPFDAPFNFSAMNNRAADRVSSDYLLLLNNDTEILGRDWLDTLLGVAEVAGAGVVGPMLLLENGLVQHAGVVLGLGNMVAEHVFIGMHPNSSVLLERLRLTQNYSAVTGACLLTKRQDYLDVGGLDEDNLPRPYQDIDFCLKISSQLGKRIVWTPDVRLIHQGSKTYKGLSAERTEKPKADPVADVDLPTEGREVEFMFAKWPTAIATDPFYNRNLMLGNRSAGIETDPLLTLGDWRCGVRVVACPNDNTGCGEYRIKAPMRTLLEAGRIDGGLSPRIFGPSEIMRLNPDVVVVQRQLEDHQVQAIQRYKKRSSSMVIYELDDLVTVGWSKTAPAKRKEHIVNCLRKGLEKVDRFIASTPRIAEEYGDWCKKETIIVPNYLPMDRWGGVHARRLERTRPRVGWAGGASHAADLEMIADVVKILQHEVEWIFLGMCPEALRPYVHEFHEGVPIEGYPARLAGMNLDLALAPLENTDFNQARTALRILEYGMLGYPVIASDMPSYRMGFPVTLVGDNVDDWVSAIRAMVSDRSQLAVAGDRLRQHVIDHWIMDKNIDVWFKAWTP